MGAWASYCGIPGNELSASASTRLQYSICVKARAESLWSWRETEGYRQTKNFGFLPMASFAKRLNNICRED